MKISFVVPVYHNEGAISKTHEKIKSVFAKNLLHCEYEIVFVDDGSKDGSLNEILSLREGDPRVKAITFTRNFGQMAAMLAGFKEATGDAIINISADLQDPVELIPQMVKKWEEGSETVICYRTDRADTWSAKLFSWLAYGVLRMALPQIPPGGFDFVLMDRKVMDEFNAIDVRHRFFQGDLLWTGYRTSFIPYVRLQRTIGKSQYNFAKKYLRYLLELITYSHSLSAVLIKKLPDLLLIPSPQSQPHLVRQELQVHQRLIQMRLLSFSMHRKMMVAHPSSPTQSLPTLARLLPPQINKLPAQLPHLA